MFAHDSTLFHGVISGQKSMEGLKGWTFYTPLDHLFDSDSSRSESEALDKIRPAENSQFFQFKSELMEFVLTQASFLYDYHFHINVYLKHKTMHIQYWFASVYGQEIFHNWIGQLERFSY